MLRKCASENLGVTPSKQQWRRTNEGKPYLVNVPESYDSYTSLSDGRVRAGYNMNVSHDGKLVAFASGRDFVLGVDVMSNSPSSPTETEEFFPIFEENFTSYEWSIIKGHKTEQKQFESFFHHWTLKESYIKSVGFVTTLQYLSCILS
jgi:phosphopantetheinyl transferase